jgi:hypothetical protein
MRRNSFGKISLVFAIIGAVLFGLHFGNIIPLLNTMLAPLMSLLGALTGLMGYFERDQKKTLALIGMLFNSAFLIGWVVLFVRALSA